MGGPLKPSKRPQARPARNVLRVDMGEHKKALDDFCAAQGLTVSQLVRSTLLPMLGGGAAVATAKPARKGAAKPSEGPRQRRELRLHPDHDAALMRRADSLGFKSFQGYVEALVRAHLTHTPQPGPAELQELGISNQRLVDIVQILRRSPAPPADLVKTIEAHLREVRAVIDNSAERWKA